VIELKSERKPCTFCQMVDYLVEQGMIDEYDKAIIARHMQQEHGKQATHTHRR
jgi:hypothetical protein